MLRGGLRLWRRGLRLNGRLRTTLDFEEDAARGAHVENRRCPLLAEASAEEGFAGFGDGGIYREAVGNRPVKLFGECFSCVIADLELHGDYGGQSLLA